MSKLETKMESNILSKAIMWHLSKGVTKITSTGPNVYCLGENENPILNSESFVVLSKFNNPSNTREISNSDKQFVKFEAQFENQYLNLKDHFGEIEFEDLKSRFSLSLSELLRFEPEVFSIELTPEASVFYTMFKNDYSFFIQHFLNISDSEDDELILTSYKGKSKLPSYGGSLDEILGEIKEIIFPPSEVKSWEPTYELSYADSTPVFQ